MQWIGVSALIVVALIVLIVIERSAARQSEQRQQLLLQQLRQELAAQGHERNQDLTQQILALRETNEQRLLNLRDVMDMRLTAMQRSNQEQLEMMRHTVDEKLHQTLEQRLSASFQSVNETLEQVHQGLGEMKSLAKGVGDLQKVLANVKTRGILGEVQLERLLADMLSPAQYERNVAVNPEHNWRVEYAVRLPGQTTDQPVYLPIDAKFPLSDYELLIAAEEKGDLAAAAAAAKALEIRVRQFAKDVQEKYICPPHTTDFAILFLPLEGLYSELARRPALLDILQKQHHVIPAGPVTLAALLNSLQMGFRSLAIEARADEVWQLLANVKAGFADFGLLLDKTQKKLQEASNSIDTAARKSRTIERRLRQVTADALPDSSMQAAISVLPGEDEI